MSYSPTGYAGSLTAVKTAVETPAALFAGAEAKPDRSRLRVTNLSAATRLRIGVNTSDLQRDGQPIEPGDTLTVYPTADLFICSEGRSAQFQIEEK